MTEGALEIDHVFVFTPPDATAEIGRLAHAGLAESNRRRHVGQGTTNVCYCFDNAYLELLWAVDAAELSTAAVARTRLAERSRWRETGASPFGLAVRPVADRDLPFETWDYQAPFLPTGLSLPVAAASEDPRQPMLFQSPGTARPDQWRNDRAGARQTSAGLAEIIAVDLTFPVDIEPDQAFEQLAADGLIGLERGSTGPSMTLTISRRDAGSLCRLSLPGCRLVER